MLVVAAFLSTLLFGYLFQWTATARAVRPMLERRQPPSSIELALLRKVPKLAGAQAAQVATQSSMCLRESAMTSEQSLRRSMTAATAAAEVFVFLSGIAAIWGVVFPFEVIGDDMLQKEFGYSADNAGFIIALAPMISICSPAFAPFLGSSLAHKLVAFGSSVATDSIFCLQNFVCRRVPTPAIGNRIATLSVLRIVVTRDVGCQKVSTGKGWAPASRS